MNTDASTISASVTRPSDRTRMSTTAIGASRSRRMIVPAATPFTVTASTRVPAAMARTPAAPGSTLADASAPRTTSTVSPPTTAPNAMTAWLASVPYQGCDSSSRRSRVARKPTHAPAVGPPSTIAAATNGKWKVHTAELPGMGSTRSDPMRPKAIQSSSPPDGPVRLVPSSPGLSAGSSGTVAVVQASAASPTTIEVPV